MPQGHGPEAPRSLGRYELVVEVAKGQLGALWLAHVGAELFAIRRVSTAAPIERVDVDRMSEAAWWSLDVRDENVATVLDVVMTEGELGIVTRYVPGELLRSLLRLSSFKRKPVASPIALRIAADILGGLTAAHQQPQPGSGVNLGSGGVNPDAVLIGLVDGRAMLLDVGIASVASSISSLSQHPELGAYSAPEQLDQTRAPDPRSDVFSLGVLLWEMISSRRLFAGSSQAVIREKLEACAVPRLDATKPVGGEPIPTEVADLVARALARDPADRFESAAAMAEAIQKLGSDMIAERSAVAGLVEDLAGQALATRSKALKRATMPQKAQVPGPRPQLPTLVGITPDSPTPAVNAPAPAPAKPLVDLAAVAAELAGPPPVIAERAAPTPEPTPEPPAMRAEEPATPEPEESAPTKHEAAEPAQGSLPQPDESVDVDVAIAADAPVSEPEPTTVRRASAPEDVFANVKVDPSPISERELVEALTRESNPGPPPLESIDFTAHGSESRITPGKPIAPGKAAAPPAVAPPAVKPATAQAPKYVVALTSNAPPAPAAAAAVPAAAAASATANAPAAAAAPATMAAMSPERSRAPLISDFEGPPSQEQIARTQKARRVVAGVVAGLGLLLVLGLIVSAIKSDDGDTAAAGAATSEGDKPRTAQAAQPAEPAQPEPRASIAADDGVEERAEKAEPSEKAEPVKKSEPAEKAEPAAKAEPRKKAEPAPQRTVAKAKSTAAATKPRSTPSKTAPASAPRPATKPKSKNTRYVPSGI